MNVKKHIRRNIYEETYTKKHIRRNIYEETDVKRMKFSINSNLNSDMDSNVFFK